MTRILSEYASHPDQTSFYAAERRGAYQAWREVVALDPSAVIATVAESGLRGRGGAGFPTGRKWGFLHYDPHRPPYLLCNADESEPGTFKDHWLLEHDPHQVIEGILIAAHAIGAQEAFLYMRGEYVGLWPIVSRALQETYQAGLAGSNILNSGESIEIIVVLGAGAYICGEETGLMESLEGKRPYPRVRPPFPAVRGFNGRPTVVNNVETLANLPWIFRQGSSAFRNVGTDESPGTKLISLSGAIAQPGVYEVPMGYPLKTLLEEEGGGPRAGRRFKAVIPGGTSVPILTADELVGITIDFESMRRAGTLLGSGGMIVFDDDASMPIMLQAISHFYATESCGECTPCREGTGWMASIVDRIANGAGKQSDLERLQRIANNIEGRTICGLGDAAVQPVRSFITKFRTEFEALLPTTEKASAPDWQRHGHGPRTARSGPIADEADRSEPIDGRPTYKW